MIHAVSVPGHSPSRAGDMAANLGARCVLQLVEIRVVDASPLLK